MAASGRWANGREYVASRLALFQSIGLIARYNLAYRCCVDFACCKLWVSSGCGF
ncbi:hypothetical protein RBSH_04115 [Rhodopirellula baltica SH28]|uniref:Uncharacterized protein n=1 Tax=Rhodopirellula baltica SH28 TaxID=993517 RepID=K5D1Z2_RHOBT|nr:hypothetical protein RBSH_04115 [Rhodopirellula baltica SH28]